MVTKINRRYSIFLVQFNAPDSVSQQPEKVPRCGKMDQKSKRCALHTKRRDIGHRFPSSSVKTGSAMKLAFSGASGETRENALRLAK